MRVGILMGGISSEREISLLSGEEVIRNLNKNKYQVIPLLINSKEEIFDKVKNIDFMFIALHGEFGEDGSIQAILETLNIPYSGSNPLTSALCMNKKQAKRILKSEGLNVPQGISLYKHGDINFESIKKLKYPMIVKPNSGGSSIGVSLVYSSEELRKAIIEAFLYWDEVLVEEYLCGSEYTVPVLNGLALPILSINFNLTFFDYQSKYNDKGTVEEVASLPDGLSKEMKFISEKSYEILDCKAYARVDIIVSNGKPYVLDINTLPGMTAASLFPKSAKTAGIEYEELLDKIIQFSLNRED